MISYEVMLEGKERDETKYFVTFEVASRSQSLAKELVLNEASKMGLNIISVEEVVVKRRLKSSVMPGILRSYGKSYFVDEE